MKKWILPVAITASLIGLTACSGDKDSETIVESKSGNITKEELYTALKEQNGEQVVRDMVYGKVLSEKYKVTDKELEERLKTIKEESGENYEAAVAQYYKTEENFKKNLKLVMMQEKAAVKDIKVSDKELKEYYEGIKPEIKARHILVADEKTAKEVKTKLTDGAKFEDLAKEYSQDPGSVEQGGDLGWFGSGEMVPEFEEAAYALEKGKISEPVKSQMGFHIIEVTDKKEKKSFKEMKKDLEHQLKLSKIDEKTLQEAMDEEIKAAKVKIKDKDLNDALKAPEASS